MSPTVRCFALTTCGLEDVSAREVAALPGARDVEVAYRRISFAHDGSPAALLRLRTVDVDTALRPAAGDQLAWATADHLGVHPVRVSHPCIHRRVAAGRAMLGRLGAAA
jgi:hypothetical protein